ncbi:hypothetical protein J6S37_03350 [Candidatus Saccharibacteria bacterium]|nr:hypothetical protein [Candidatus Saccharibacteria bacterium]
MQKRYLRYLFPIIGLILISFFVSITTGLGQTKKASALTLDQINNFSQNNILFYDPDICSNQPINNGIYKGEPFTGMTQELLTKFAAAGVSENGTNGTAFELSLLANLYEKNRCSSQNCLHTAADLADYLKSGSWFADTTKQSFELGKITNNNSSPTQESINLAKVVLVNGNRVAPKGIDEHDDINDITEIQLDGQAVDKTKQQNYVSGKTIIKNKMGSTYKFYAWCDGEKTKTGTTSSECDPFGYTNELDLGNSYSLATTTGLNTNYNGRSVLTESELQQVEDNKAVYQEAAAEYNIPWQVLAAVHYEEYNLQVKNPDNGQGVYQMFTYTNGGTNANRFTPGPIDTAEFLRQTKLAAKDIRDSVGADANFSDDNVAKLAFFAYNGKAKIYREKAVCMGFDATGVSIGEGSPYVMNMYDAKRDPDSSGMSSCWPGAYTGDGVWSSSATSSRPGAFVVYQALGGSNSTDSCGYDGTWGAKIATTALDLAWEGVPSGHGINDPKPEYVAAMREAGTYTNYCPSAIGASCDQFVATVMIYSGADPEIQQWGAQSMGDYMTSHPEKYQVIAFDGSNPEILKPGDIFATDYYTGNHGHIYIYVEVNGKAAIAHASYCGRTAEYQLAAPYVYDNGGSRHYKVYRRV